MKKLLCILLIYLTPACAVDMSIGLGTFDVHVRASVDEWAQANVLKGLDVLLAKAVEDEEDKETVVEEEAVEELSPKEEAVPE